MPTILPAKQKNKEEGSYSLTRKEGLKYNPPGTMDIDADKRAPSKKDEENRRHNVISEKEGSYSLTRKEGLKYQAPGEAEKYTDTILKSPADQYAKKLGEKASEVALGKNKKVSEEEKKAWEEKQNKLKEQREKFAYRKVGDGKVEKVKIIED